MELQVTRQDPRQTAESFGSRLYAEAATRGLTVSQLLERMDPTAEREQNDRDLDAFERVLQSAGMVTTSIPESGIRATDWETATSTPAKRAMIHEFMARVWRQTTHGQPMSPQTRAMLLSGDAAINTLANTYSDDLTIRAKELAPPIPISSIVARTQPIDGDAYRTLYITDDLGTDAYRMKRVAEGADIPSTTLVTGEHTLRLEKFGRALRATYEQLRRQRIDRVAFIVSRMAIQAEVDKAAIAINTIVNGDGNANTAATVIALTALDAAASAGTLTLKGWLAHKLRFANYIPDTVLMQEASALQLLMLNVGNTNQIPLALLPAGPFGSLRPLSQPRLADGIAYGVTTDAPALKLVTFDSSRTIERVVEIGGQVSEVERFITNQTQVLTLTEVEGYGVIDPNAARVLNINA